MRLNRSLVLVLLAANIPVSAIVTRENPGQSEKPRPVVGMVTRAYVDEARKNWQGTGPRPLATSIWYPAGMAASEEAVFGRVAPEQRIFTPITIAPGAELSSGARKYPLVLLSHGTGGSAVMMMWLGHYLASHGYITAAVTHHGNSLEEGQITPQGFMLFTERPKDLTAVLDKLLADPLFGDRIDRERIGAAGFSLGGYTVIAIAGGRFSRGTFDAFCNSPQRDFTCEPQPEFPEARTKFEELEKTDAYVQESLRHSGDSFRDPRIKAVLAIAPALGSGFTAAGLSKINIPVRLIVGAGDPICPPATNAERLAKGIKSARLTILPGNVAHYTFLAECTPHGKEVAPICRDADGVDRGAVHQEVSRLTDQFFRQAFKGK